MSSLRQALFNYNALTGPKSYLIVEIRMKQSYVWSAASWSRIESFFSVTQLVKSYIYNRGLVYSIFMQLQQIIGSVGVK